MPFRLSWQIAAIWLAGLSFAALLSSAWRAAFFLIALWVTTRYLPPVMNSYISLFMIAIFLGAVEGYKRIEVETVRNALAAAALVLVLWMSAQACGVLPCHFSARHAGPFNPDSGGIFLAICLWGVYRFKWSWLIPGIIWAIWVTQASTGFIAAAASILVYGVMRFRNNRRAIAGVMIAIIAAGGIWLKTADSIDGIVYDQRWIVWKHAAWSMRSEAFGRGLGSWQDIFPLLASGDRRIGDVQNINGQVVMNNVFYDAHSQIAHTAFELGAPMVLLITAFLLFVAYTAVRGRCSPDVAAGIAAIAVACFGWNVFNIIPLAVIGAATIGPWESEVEKSTRRTI